MRRTPLYAAHVSLNAKLVPFAGFEMPLQYTGIVAEHQMVRNQLGLFDVSHMGEVELRGPRAREAAQRLVTADMGKLGSGRAVYTVMCNPEGGIVDDCIVYQRTPERLLIVINAANLDKDTRWIRQHAAPLADVVDLSDETALIAVQGPRAVGILEGLVRVFGEPAAPLSQVPSFAFVDGTLAGKPVTLARTGYTGEDGFEIFCRSDDALAVWSAVLERARAAGGGPAGLGARDTLRLEAALRLYGQDMDDATTPYEAGLGWVVKLDGGDFIGKAALARQKAEGGPQRKLVGLKMQGRGIARHGYDLYDSAEGGSKIGVVTSGTTGPTVGAAIALGFVPPRFEALGTELFVDCRGKRIPAVVVKTPFYRRKS